MLKYITEHKRVSLRIYYIYKAIGSTQMYICFLPSHRTQAKTWLTTGWHAMLLALDTCDEINVYGMVYDEYCQ